MLPVRTTPRRRTTLAAHSVLAAGAVVLAGALAACSTQPPDPTDAANAYASALESGNLSTVTFTGSGGTAASATMAKATTALAGTTHTVTLTNLSHQPGATTATATYSHRWDLKNAQNDWQYDTTAELTLADDVWKVTWAPATLAPDLAADERLAVVQTWPRRANILDAAGQPIVMQREVSDVGIDKVKAGGKAAASAAALAKLLGINAANYTAKVTGAGASAFVPALRLRKTDPLLATAEKGLAAIPGATQVPSLAVLGPSATWASPILGTVADATAEQVQDSKGTLRAGDEVGQNGLQYRYDSQLRGAPGLAVQAQKLGADGSVIGKRELYAEVSAEGKPLQTTLEVKAQNAAEAALAGQTATPTALVVMRVSTGEIIAAAVGPGAKGAPLALAGKAAPGSTFKIVSSLAMVRKGATPDTKVPCTPTLTVNGRVFGNYSEFPPKQVGDVPLKTALAYSCNTAFISQYKAVSQDDLRAAAESLGLGELELPFTAFMGSVPPTSDVVMHAATFIGQGQVEASPLAMATVMASAMRGQTVRPRLVKDADLSPAPAVPLQPAEAEKLRTEMREVVAVGSGKRLAANKVEFAKTGTAEFGTTNPPKTHAWMVAGRGDLAFAAYNEIGPSGSTHAGPFISAFLTAYDKP